MTWKAVSIAVVLSLSACTPALQQVAPQETLSRSQAQATHVRDNALANAHRVQTMVETYAVDHDGDYPPDIETLRQVASQGPQPYWREIHNPLGDDKAAVVTGVKPVPGGVGYVWDDSSQRYYIRIWDATGHPIKDSRGEFFVLTNN